MHYIFKGPCELIDKYDLVVVFTYVMRDYVYLPKIDVKKNTFRNYKTCRTKNRS